MRVRTGKLKRRGLRCCRLQGAGRFVSPLIPLDVSSTARRSRSSSAPRVFRCRRTTSPISPAKGDASSSSTVSVGPGTGSSPTRRWPPPGRSRSKGSLLTAIHEISTRERFRIAYPPRQLLGFGGRKGRSFGCRTVNGRCGAPFTILRCRMSRIGAFLIAIGRYAPPSTVSRRDAARRALCPPRPRPATTASALCACTARVLRLLTPRRLCSTIFAVLRESYLLPSHETAPRGGLRAPGANTICFVPPPDSAQGAKAR